MSTNDILCNLRDVGGIKLRGGGTTRFGMLYRGDAPLFGDRPPDLRPWPPRTVIDLRTSVERAGLSGECWPTTVQTHQLSLYGDLDPIALARRNGSSDVSELLTTLFTEIIQSRPSVLVSVVSEVAAGPPSVAWRSIRGTPR